MQKTGDGVPLLWSAIKLGILHLLAIIKLDGRRSGRQIPGARRGFRAEAPSGRRGMASTARNCSPTCQTQGLAGFAAWSRFDLELESLFHQGASQLIHRLVDPVTATKAELDAFVGAQVGQAE